MNTSTHFDVWAATKKEIARSGFEHEYDDFLRLLLFSQNHRDDSLFNPEGAGKLFTHTFS
ncbi:MAG: hypothetical protein HQK52_20350 [Oligoflexia bacterium]|nr:hypothetical protein [Oligoflexia bacterium]